MNHRVTFSYVRSILLMSSNFGLDLMAFPTKGPRVEVLTPCCLNSWGKTYWTDKNGVQKSRYECHHGSVAPANPILFLPDLEEDLIPWLSQVDPLEAPLIAAAIDARIYDLIVFPRSRRLPLHPLIPELASVTLKSEAAALYSGDLFPY